ncbi:uncharacterized protein LOC128164072 isoform X2 [Crassostrea angulata]|uniref:uncharacterized protein isoform X2 n=1 Tax=Magallana gigas TaxID=29159 RepID=UPI0022B20DEF|nr:uncharacterized protein LOC128164072 isoform X2 [Crassostrea angulata]
MGNKEEKWTQCVTLAVLLMMVMTVEGTDPVCRPFCHLPPETHEKCSSLRFLFSCISKVKMRCTMNLHCSCEWLHALENVYLESERLAKVRNSNIFEQCTGTLTEDCDEWKEKWSHVPCVRINKKASTNDTRNPEMQLKLNEIRASVMKLKDKAKRRRLLKNLNALMNKMPWENVAENVSSASYNSNDKGKPLASAIRLSEGSQQTNYSEWMGSIDSWHRKVLFEHWEKVSQADIMETLHRRRTFLLLFGVLTGATAFIIVMLFVIKYQSDKNVRKDIVFDGNLDVMGREDSFSFLDKLRKEKRRKGKDVQLKPLKMNSLTMFPKKVTSDTKPKTDYRRKPQISQQPTQPTKKCQPDLNKVSIDAKKTIFEENNKNPNTHSQPLSDPQTEQVPEYALKSSSSYDIGDRLFPSAMMRSFGTEFGTPSQKTTNTLTDSNEQSTSQTVRATSPKRPESTQEPSTSPAVRVTSPLLIPVNHVTTVKISPKRFLSSDESTSTSSSSSSSSSTSATTTGSSNG